MRKPMRALTACLGIVLCLSVHSLQTQVVEAAPQQASAKASFPRQLLVVRSASWNSATGVLSRYQRQTKDGPWRRVGESVPVNLGRRGMAWGRGLQPGGLAGPTKHEGDGRSPAGLFRLGSAFGAAKSLPEGASAFPYLPTTETSYCVEDTRSAHYNEFVDSRTVEAKGWERWSPLRRSDGLFRWGIVVRQNAPDVVVGAGSCVFLHIWRGPKRPTAGCTAMEPDAIETLLGWLDPNDLPTIAQLPDPVYTTLAEDWDLPR